MRNTFQTRLYIGFTLAILLSAASSITSYVILQKQQRQREWVRKARSILDTTGSIQNILIDMEAGRRGFRATNQKRFLEPYYSGQVRLQANIARLKELLSDDPGVENVEQLLVTHINSILKLWSDAGEDMSIYSREDITRLTDDEKGRMDQVRELIKELQKDESKLLSARREEYDQLIQYGTFSTSIDSILSGIIIIVLIYVILREFRSRKKIQEQLHQYVEQLQEKTEVLQKSETELKNTTDELSAINKQLEQFVYTVAHDIKSPLTGIIGALDIIKSDDVILEHPKLAQFANLSSEAAMHLSNMINVLLEYSRQTINQHPPEPVDTKELLDHLIILLFPPRNIHIYIDEKMPVVVTRKVKIIQVFQNLISNAIKYMDKERGIIDIGCNDKGGGYYDFFVKDNGQGIAREYQDKIFALSRTANNVSSKDSSTGFGLNIAKLIVEEQGGKIWFDSVPGEGTTFYFEWKK